jgi:hypothetical protein
LREDVRAYHLVNRDFQLLWGLDIESEVWKVHSIAREPDRLEYGWDKLIGR